jgi:hypothetical protein
MVRKQIYLTVAQDTRLRRLAEQQRRSEAEVLREALDRYLPSLKPSEPLEGDPLFRLVGLGSSAGTGDLSERVDDVLYGGGGA